MAPLRAQAKASEAIVAATTMISAYSVVWEPVSAPNGCDEAVRLDNDTVLTGMATPSQGVDMKDVRGDGMDEDGFSR
jgi:hypothetical protein